MLFNRWTVDRMIETDPNSTYLLAPVFSTPIHLAPTCHIDGDRPTLQRRRTSSTCQKGCLASVQRFQEVPASNVTTQDVCHVSSCLISARTVGISEGMTCLDFSTVFPCARVFHGKRAVKRFAAPQILPGILYPVHLKPMCRTSG